MSAEDFEGDLGPARVRAATCIECGTTVMREGDEQDCPHCPDHVCERCIVEHRWECAVESKSNDLLDEILSDGRPWFQRLH